MASKVTIGNASIDERGQSTGGMAGDQTGKEVVTKPWYKHSKGWRLLRCKDYAKAGRIAEAMERACANNHIGYDQYQRDTLLKEAAKYAYDTGKVTKDVECDCSALVRVCIAYAYGQDVVDTWRNGARWSTANMCGILLKAGDFVELPDSEAQTDKYVRRGDILCTKTQGHTVVVLNDGEKASYTDEPAIDFTNLKCPYARPTVTMSQKKNRKHTGVQWVQWHLNFVMEQYGGEPKLIVDGIYGPKTEAAVRAFQKYMAIKVDGITGPITCGCLLDEYNRIVTGGESEIDTDYVEPDDGGVEWDDNEESEIITDEYGNPVLSPEEEEEVKRELGLL